MADLTEVALDDPHWAAIGLPHLAERAAKAALAAVGLTGDWTISVLGTDDARIAGLNAEFRGKAGPTNVLSWPAQDLSPPRPGAAPYAPEAPPGPWPAELGDIALAWETCLREAEAAAVLLPDHVTHLILHACLHLLGYDHENDADAARMEALESETLATLGIADPYSRRAGPEEAGPR